MSDWSSDVCSPDLQVQRGRRLLGQAVAGAKLDRALTVDCLPVLPCRLHSHVALVHQGQLRLRVAQRVDDTEHAVAAAERSEERRVGAKGGSAGRSRWSQTHKKKKKK